MSEHSDKCCYWDDETYCDCGATEIDRLKAENAKLHDIAGAYSLQIAHKQEQCDQLAHENIELEQELAELCQVAACCIKAIVELGNAENADGPVDNLLITRPECAIKSTQNNN